MQSGLILMPFFSWLLKRQFHQKAPTYFPTAVYIIQISDKCITTSQILLCSLIYSCIERGEENNNICYYKNKISSSLWIISVSLPQQNTQSTLNSMCHGATELQVEWDLELAFAEEGNTEGREVLVGQMNASHCLWQGKTPRSEQHLQKAVWVMKTCQVYKEKQGFFQN